MSRNQYHELSDFIGDFMCEFMQRSADAESCLCVAINEIGDAFLENKCTFVTSFTPFKDLKAVCDAILVAGGNEIYICSYTVSVFSRKVNACEFFLKSFVDERHRQAYLKSEA